jgi:hypothetical protein
MKIVALVRDCGSFKPRDVRNYVGSIVDEKFKDLAMWHKHATPELIYVKPFKNSFEIISPKNDITLISHIAEKIEKNRDFYGKKIEKVFLKNEQFLFPQRGLTCYSTRTPIIIALNSKEIGITLACKKNNEMDDLKRYLTHRIESDAEFQIKEWFGLDLKINEFAITSISNIKQLFLDYKDGIKFPAITMDFVCNYRLPRFIGYKIGLGWGEIIEKNLLKGVN